MAGRIDSYASSLCKINPQVSTAEETAKKLNVDKSLIERAAQKLGVDVLADPACRNYFKTMGQSLQVLTTRHWETDYKADAGRVADPRAYTQTAFLARDTSQGQLYQDRIPDISEGLINHWQEIGFLKPKQAEAMHKIFFSNQTPSADQEVSGNDQDEYAQFLENFSRREDASVQAQQVRGYEASPAGGAKGHTIGMGLTRNLMGGIPSAPPPPATPVSVLGVMDPEQNDRATLNSYFSEDDSARGWIGGLLDSESKARDTVSNLVLQTEETAQKKRDIMAELSGIDSSTPEGAKKLALAQYNLSDVQDSERQLTDQMQNVLRWRTERIEMVSKILDIQNQSLKQTSSKMN
ncbi:MAG: hypothetical protein HQM15_10090 [Deltaproteobacteria bacterium]|nr:hypothetical protein [Deltaproteobacteria bacterium]